MLLLLLLALLNARFGGSGLGPRRVDKPVDVKELIW